MRAAVKKLFQTKNLVLLLFAAGFFCFFIFGRTVLDDISLLDSVSLKRIRDAGIDKGSFFQYVCISQFFLLLTFCFCWWHQKGSICVYSFLAMGAFSLGTSLAVSLMRYHFKGIVLWVVLYFPHTISYYLALYCAMALSYHRCKGRAEKIHCLMQNMKWILGMIASLLLAIYLESYVSSTILQKYLEYF